jgi:DNA-directed RNA polymerase subunit beta'
VGVVTSRPRAREVHAALWRASGQEGQEIKASHANGTVNEPFIADVNGIVQFKDIVEGKTYQERVDDMTQRATYTIIEYRTTSFRPSISINDDKGAPVPRPGSALKAEFPMPVGAILMVKDGDETGRRHRCPPPARVLKTRTSSAACPAWPSSSNASPRTRPLCRNRQYRVLRGE